MLCSLPDGKELDLFGPQFTPLGLHGFARSCSFHTTSFPSPRAVWPLNGLGHLGSPTQLLTVAAYLCRLAAAGPLGSILHSPSPAVLGFRVS